MKAPVAPAVLQRSLRSERGSEKFLFFIRGWITSLPCPQFLQSPRWKNKLPVCFWRVVTPLDF